MTAIRKTNRLLVVWKTAAITLLAGLANADGPWTCESESAVTVDTRSLSQVATADDNALDTRSYTVDWSEARKLNTKKIIGTMVIMR